MLQGEDQDEELERGCAEAVGRLLERHDWRLIERDAFVRRSLAHLLNGAASDPIRAATYTYSLALYDACSGREGAARQDVAYGELFRYLYDSAYWRYREICDDVTQEAIKRVLLSFDRCRSPGAFLAWAFQQLRDAARTLHRQDAREGALLETPAVWEAGDVPESRFPDPRQVEPAQHLLDGEQRDRLNALVEAFLQRHPRAKQQILALLLKYIEGLDDQAISQRLGKPAASIHVLRARAKQKLQQEPDWRRLALELGLLRDGNQDGIGADS